MDPVHDRGCMDPVHESGPWTRSKVGVHGPLVHNRLKFDSRIFYSVVQETLSSLPFGENSHSLDSG